MSKWDIIAAEYAASSVHGGGANFICLSETWLRGEDDGGFFIDGYVRGSHFNRSSRKGGGVAIWHKEDLAIKHIILDNFCIEGQFEVCGVEWSVDS